jgi:hypothetical protein
MKYGSPHNLLRFGSSWGAIEFAEEERHEALEVGEAGEAASIGDDGSHPSISLWTTFH